MKLQDILAEKWRARGWFCIGLAVLILVVVIALDLIGVIDVGILGLLF